MSVLSEELSRMAGYATVPESKAVFEVCAKIAEKYDYVFQSERQLRERIARELAEYPEYRGVMKIAAGLVDGSYTPPEWDAEEDAAQPSVGGGDAAYSSVLEHIAASLDLIADALDRRTAAKKHPVRIVRAKKKTVDRDTGAAAVGSEDEYGNPVWWAGRIPEPDRERCGYLIEHYPHPLDKTGFFYQVSRDGSAVTFSSDLFEEIDGLDDEGFAAALALRFPERTEDEGGEEAHWDAVASQAKMESGETGESDGGRS